MFAMNLSELGKTSLVQHDIKLDDMTPHLRNGVKGYPHISMKTVRTSSGNAGDRSHLQIH